MLPDTLLPSPQSVQTPAAHRAGMMRQSSEQMEFCRISVWLGMNAGGQGTEDLL